MSLNDLKNELNDIANVELALKIYWSLGFYKLR